MDWDVLLIGGSPGTGKSVLAQMLARSLRIDWIQVDDLRLALQRVITPALLPDVHFFRATPLIWERSPEELRSRLAAVGAAMSPAIAAVVDHHLATPYPVILEGDSILPELAAQLASAPENEERVRSLFLIEPTEAGILKNMAERGRSFDEQPVADRLAQVRMNWLYNRWLADEAGQRGLPTICNRPRETLLSRALSVLG